MREEKKRHGCLTAWLIVIILISSFTLLSYLVTIFSRNMIRGILQNPAYRDQMGGAQLLQIQTVLNIPVWFFMILMGFAIFNIVCAVALFLWKKWGFWGYLVSSIVTLVLNIFFVNSGVTSIIIGIVSASLLVLILFGVLHIGRENKGWPQLK